MDQMRLQMSGTYHTKNKIIFHHSNKSIVKTKILNRYVSHAFQRILLPPIF